MTVTLAQIGQMFQDVETGRLSRETAHKFANGVMEARDSGDLYVEPESDFDTVSKAVVLLQKADDQFEPEAYIYSLGEDFPAWRDKLGIPLPHPELPQPTSATN